MKDDFKLTHQEQTPYFATRKVSYGDVGVDEVEWDIDALCKAQLDKLPDEVWAMLKKIKEKCPRCFDGKIRDSQRGSNGFERCDACKGSGYVYDFKRLAILSEDQTLDAFLKIVGKHYPDFLDIIKRDGWIRTL